MSRVLQRFGCIFHLVILSKGPFGHAQQRGLNGKLLEGDHPAVEGTGLSTALDRSAVVTGVQHSITWRDVLMEEARRRTAMYADESLLDAPQTKDGITIRVMKEDSVCGGVRMPVVYTYFTMPQVRPVDIFNMLTVDRKGAVQKCGNVVRTSAGEFPAGAIRAWSTHSSVAMVGKIVFTEWEVVNADVVNEDFWYVSSTMQNHELIEEHPLEQGASEADDCLASWHITKDPGGGARVLGSRHVNIRSLDWFPMHFAFQNFPPAWEQTIVCVNTLREESLIQNALNWSKAQLVVPDWMLESGDHLFLPPGVIVDEGVFSKQDVEIVPTPNSNVPSMLILGLCIALCYCFWCNCRVSSKGKTPRTISCAERFGFSRATSGKCGNWSQVNPEPLDSDTEAEDTEDEHSDRVYHVVSPPALSTKTKKRQDTHDGEPRTSNGMDSLESDQADTCSCMPKTVPSLPTGSAESTQQQDPHLGKPCESRNDPSLPLEPTLDSDEVDTCACMPEKAHPLPTVSESAERQDLHSAEPGQNANADSLDSAPVDMYGCMPDTAFPWQNPELGKPCKSTNPSLAPESTLDSEQVDLYGCMPDRARSSTTASADSRERRDPHLGKPCNSTNNPSLPPESTLDSGPVDTWGCTPSRRGSSVGESAESAAQENLHLGKPCESKSNPSFPFESTLDSDQVDTWGCMPENARSSGMVSAESAERQNHAGSE